MRIKCFCSFWLLTSVGKAPNRMIVGYSCFIFKFCFKLPSIKVIPIYISFSNGQKHAL